MRASSRGHAACVNVLLPVSDPFATNDFGMTALMLAAWMNYEACVKLLLPISDVLQKDTSGLSSREYARRLRHKSLTQFIDTNILAQSDQTVMERAVGYPRKHAASRM